MTNYAVLGTPCKNIADIGIRKNHRNSCFKYSLKYVKHKAHGLYFVLLAVTHRHRPQLAAYQHTSKMHGSCPSLAAANR